MNCAHPNCPWDVHVVLYADGHGTFAGHDVRNGEPLGFCLKHGGQVYDALKARREGLGPDAVAPWLLTADRTVTHLPRVKQWPDRPAPRRPSYTGGRNR